MKMSIIEIRDILVRFFLFIGIFLFLTLVLESCGDKCTSTNTYFYYEPVYTGMQEIRAQVDIVEPQPFTSNGKIYIYGNTLFVNDPGNGIHVIDNSDPSSPVFKNYINIPGTYDLAVKDNFLYADSYVDIVVFDIQNVNQIKQVNRLEDVYQSINSFGVYASSELGVVTEWVQSETVEIVEDDCESQVGFRNWGGGILVDFAFFSADASVSAAPESLGNPVQGQGGSTARFAISNNNLYAVDDWQMYVFDASSPSDPQLNSKVDLGWGIETIFPYKDNLFIGANNGMHIYDNSDPLNPQYISSFAHTTACDPVVVDDKYAYVTLRSGNACQGFVNQLDVINIENLSNPTLLKTYQMDNPHGLGVDGDQLFLCEADFGLKVFDIADRQAIDDNLIHHFEDIHAYDVIPFNDVLIMIGDDGLYQYDYSDPENLELLSHMVINNSENE